jgi:hypothetical protein
MRLQSVLARSLSTTIIAVTLAAGFSAPALASPASRNVAPNDTQEWGNDKVRVAVSGPATLSVGPSGGSVQSSSGAGASGSSLQGSNGSAPAADTQLSVDYCVELDLTDGSSGPYRLRFHVDGAGGTTSSSAPGHTTAASRRSTARVRLPMAATVTLTFNLATAADAWVTTTGDLGLIGAIYDANGQLVAGDGSSGRIAAAALAAGDYSLLLQGGNLLTGGFTVMADQASCSN